MIDDNIINNVMNKININNNILMIFNYIYNYK